MVLLDLTLSKKNGLEVLTEIKQDKKIKITIMTLLSLSKTSDIKEIKKLGVTNYIVKSDLSIDMLADKVEELLK